MGYNIGDRVPYIIADKALHKTDNKVFRKAEDPIYFLEHDMLPDLDYYTEQIITCTANVLAPVYEERLKQGAQSQLQFDAAPPQTQPSPSMKRPRQSDAAKGPPTKKSRQFSMHAFFKPVNATEKSSAPRFAGPEKKRAVRKVRTTQQKSDAQEIPFG
jgi:hypothetical protein